MKATTYPVGREAERAAELAVNTLKDVVFASRAFKHRSGKRWRRDAYILDWVARFAEERLHRIAPLLIVAGLMESVDMEGLNPSAKRRGGSNPPPGTIISRD